MPVAVIQSRLYTNTYMNAPRKTPVITSNKECCLMNTVDRIMENAKMPEPMEISFLLRSVLLCITARWAPMELYTWILGQRFVGVSVFQRAETREVKILSLGIWVSRRSWPLGKRVDMIRKTVIPVNRKAHAL